MRIETQLPCWCRRWNRYFRAHPCKMRIETSLISGATLARSGISERILVKWGLKLAIPEVAMHRIIISERILVKWGLKHSSGEGEGSGSKISERILVKWGLKPHYPQRYGNISQNFRAHPCKMRIETPLPSEVWKHLAEFQSASL